MVIVVGTSPVQLDLRSYADSFGEAGFAVVPRVLESRDVELLREAIAAVPDSDAVRRKRGVYGVRNLFDICPAVRALAARPEIRRFVTPVLGEGAFAARVVFFDKVAGANWALGWHQDNVIAVRERRDVPGFSVWGEKAGVWQVQPPAEILSRMLAVRVHLDDCGADNGPLRVIPGSHRDGWLDDSIEEWKARVPAVTCLAESGGIVTMCPLLLHASSRAESPHHRRVIHIEYANEELPGGLEWRWRVGVRR